MKKIILISFLLNSLFLFSQSAEVGQTRGELSVSLSGAATYSVPISVPVGINGVEPKISLVYNSQSKNGIAGYGWGISGLSSISRIPSTLYHDGVIDPVDYTDDKFALDGQRLIVKNTYNYGAPNAQYVTEEYSNINIGTNNQVGGMGFTVSYPDGSVAYYGYSEDSRSINGWAITYWENPQGLRISYTYDKSDNYFKIMSIKYGSKSNLTPINEIKFIYSNRLLPEQVFIGNQSTVLKKTLKRIEILSNNVGYKNYFLDHDSTELNYERLISITEKNGDATKQLNPISFSYKPNSIGISPNIGIDANLNFDSSNKKFVVGDFCGNYQSDYIFYEGSKLIIQNTELDVFNNNIEHTVINNGGGLYNGLINTVVTNNVLRTNGTSGSYLYKKDGFTVVGEYRNSNLDFFEKKFKFRAYTYNETNPTSLNFESEIIVTDPAGYQSSYPNSGTIQNPFIDKRKFISGDFDGDGLTDVLMLPIITTERFGLEISGDYFNTYLISLRKDIVAPNNVKNVGLLSNLDININDTTVIKIEVADFNGDGKSDLLFGLKDKLLVYTLNKQNTALYLLSSVNLNEIDEYDSNHIFVGDFNGDGKSDITFTKTSPGTNVDLWKFYISKGTSFLALNSPLGIPHYRQYQNIVNTTYYDGPYFPLKIQEEQFVTIQTNYLTYDFNNDGKSDIVQYRNHVLNGINRYALDGSFVWDESGKGTSIKTEMKLATNKCDIGSNIMNFFNTSGSHINSSGHLLGLNAIPLIAISYYRTPTIAFIQKNAIYTCYNSNRGEGIATLEKVTSSTGVTDIITYNYFNPSNPTQNQPYKQSISEISFPNINIPNFNNYSLVSSIENTVNSVSKKQHFSYFGGVYNTQGLGFLGFQSVLKSNWYNDTSNIISNLTKFDITKRGAPIESFSVLGNVAPDFVLTMSAPFISRSIIFYNSNPLLSNKVFKLQKTFVNNINGLEGTNKEISFTYNTNNSPTQIITTTKKGVATEKTLTETFTYLPLSTSPYLVDRLSQKNNAVTISPSGNTTSSEELYTYNVNLVTQIKKKGDATFYITEDNIYDTFGNVTKKTVTVPSLAPRISNFEYDVTGRFLTKKTDIEGFITNYTYDSNKGFLLTESFPSLTTTTLKNTYTYDTWGKLISKSNIYNNLESYSYQNLPDKSVLKITQGDDGSSSRITIDPIGREIKSEVKDINDNWSVVDTEYDILDRIVKKTQPYNTTASVWNEMQYDIYGRLSQATNLKSGSSPGKITTYTYSETNTTEYDGVKSKITIKNSLDQPVTIIETPGGTINYQYFANGNLKSTTCNGATITIVQDGWGNKKELIDPSAGNRKYDYNNFGELTREEVVGQGETSYVIDNVGKISSKIIKDAGGNVKSTSTYTYNTNNKLVEKIQFDDIDNGSSIINSFEYDNYNNITNTSEEINGQVAFGKKISYDSFGRPEQLTQIAQNLMDGTTSEKTTINTFKNGYNWQILDDVTGLPIWETQTVNAQGQILTASFGNDITIANTYDIYGFPIENKHNKGLTNIMTLTNTFDPIRGNLLTRSNNLFGTWSETLAYDTADRLTQYKDASGVQTQSYNDNGTISSNNLGDHAYTISGKPYQVSTVTPVDQTPTSPVLNYYLSRTQNIEYNIFKSPISIKEATKENIDFDYNSNNTRAIMYYGSLDTDKLLRPIRKYYSSDGTMELEIKTSTLSTIEFTNYIGGDGYSAPVVLKSDGVTPSMYYMHRDYQGSIVAITDFEAKLVEKRLFDVWGELIQYQSASVTTPPTTTGSMFIDRGYTGHEHLLGVNIINMNGRIYDQKFHRFLQPDNNIQEPANTQNYNRYAYVMNNPTKYTDPSGETWGGFFTWLGGALFSAYIHGSQSSGNGNPFQWNSQQWTNFGLNALSSGVSYAGTTGLNNYTDNYGKPSKAQQDYMNNYPIVNILESHSFANSKKFEIIDSNPNMIDGTLTRVINTTEEAVDHYYNGFDGKKGVSAVIGDKTVMELLKTDKFQEKYNRIVMGIGNGKVTTKAGSFSIDLTTDTFHAGRTNVDYKVSVLSTGKINVSFRLFVRDGFWDPNIIAEKLGIEKADGPGPNLEFEGGTPYYYNTKIINYYNLTNPGYK